MALLFICCVFACNCLIGKYYGHRSILPYTGCLVVFKEPESLMLLAKVREEPFFGKIFKKMENERHNNLFITC